MATQPTAESTAFVRQVLEEFFTDGSFDLVGEKLTDEFAYHTVTLEDTPGLVQQLGVITGGNS